MLSRHGGPGNRAPDPALDPVRWPSGRWSVTPPAPGGSDRWTLAEVDDGPDPDETGPTADHGSAPDAWAEAFHAGFCLGLDGETPVVPGTLSPYLARAYSAGVVAGSRELDRRVDAMFADRDESGPRETDGYAPGYYS